MINTQGNGLKVEKIKLILVYTDLERSREIFWLKIP